LIINIDETGFGASRSGRLRSKKVIVPKEYEEIPLYRQRLESHFITAISAVSLSGDALFPAFITKRGTDHLDAKLCSFYGNVQRYQSENAFVTRDIFLHYLNTIVLPHLKWMREKHPEMNSQAFILFDGHKAHLSELLCAWSAENEIGLYLLPPHSSHLTQPLDRGYFRMLKSSFQRMDYIPGLSKISDIQERMFMAFQASNVTRKIWNSRAASGIVPVIDEGMCVGFELVPDKVLERPAVALPLSSGEQAQQGRKVTDPSFGLLNEDEMLIYQAGQCPFCCQPLD
jgi:hypothetical protein